MWGGNSKDEHPLNLEAKKIFRVDINFVLINCDQLGIFAATSLMIK